MRFLPRLIPWGPSRGIGDPNIARWVGREIAEHAIQFAKITDGKPGKRQSRCDLCKLPAKVTAEGVKLCEDHAEEFEQAAERSNRRSWF